MRVLLDTHAILWWWTDPDQFRKATLAKLCRPDTEVLISSVSAFELAYKNRNGQLPLPPGLLDDFEDILREERWTPLPLSTAHSLTAGQLNSPHKDPFDRLLAAQALTEKATLVTSDPAFATFKGLKLMW